MSITDKSVMIGYVHGTTVHADFVHCLLRTIVYDASRERLLQSPGGWANNFSGPNVSMPRNQLVGQFLMSKAEWLLMLDTDISFPPQLPSLMLARAMQLDATVLSGLYWGVRPNQNGSGLAAFPVVYGFPAHPDDDLEPLAFLPNRPVKVAAAGAGCMLVHRTAFLDVLAKNYSEHLPWFAETERGGHLTSEDIEFCQRLTECGHDVWFDPSIEVAHLKTVPVHTTTSTFPLISSARDSTPPPEPAASAYPNWFRVTAEENFRALLPVHKTRALQIGAFTGDASLAILDLCPLATLTDVDTWAGSSDEEIHSTFDWEDVYATYFRRIDPFDDRVSTHRTTSDDFFSYNERTFDFIYIDGSHETEQVARDAENAHAVLEIGGILTFDDYTWGEPDFVNAPRPAIDAFIEKHEHEYLVLARNSQAWLQRIVRTS